jgi:Cof subfamily protein (haloacid dehalogenase superfamily)
VRFRALALDLDGTLLRPDDTISERNVRALRAAEDAGWHIILATARWYQQAERAAALLGLTGPAIACSGAEVRRLSDGSDLMDVRLPWAFASAVYEICEANRSIVYAALDREVLMRAEGPLPEGAELLPEMRYVERLTAEPPVKPRILLIQGTKVNQQIVEKLAPQWEHDVRFMTSLSPQSKSLLTLTAAGAHKGVALGVACIELGLMPEDVVAIGDADNDIEMFKVAGGSFAMGQAAPEVQAAATAVTATNAEDGVAVAVERLLAEGEAAFG